LDEVDVLVYQLIKQRLCAIGSHVKRQKAQEHISSIGYWSNMVYWRVKG
jgi:hypothetical protein